MKSVGWKDLLEIVGIFAVVASLIFVGLQMQQTLEIARIESAWNSAQSEYQSRSGIYEHPEVWRKGNAGEDLNPAESEIYATMIRDTNTHAFYSWRGRDTYGDETGAHSAIAGLAGFLYENPGARKEWEQLRAKFRRYRVTFRGSSPNRFEELVRADMEVRDNPENP